MELLLSSTHLAWSICWRYSKTRSLLSGRSGAPSGGVVDETGKSGGVIGSDGDDEPDTEPDIADETT